MRLILFFTRGISLKTWDDVGMFEREVALYRQLQEHDVQSTFVTYGSGQDLGYTPRLNGIGIFCNRWRLPQSLYRQMLCRLYPFSWRGSVVLKSNQLWGADVALRVARRCGKKFIARCGYLPSDFVARENGPDSSEAQRARVLERRVFSAADHVVVTTQSMRRVLLTDYSIAPERVTVIPNYVETELFRPAKNGSLRSKRICFVGRLEEQKNPLALLEAVKGLDVELSIIGNGSLGERLREEARRENLAVNFLGNVPHRELSEIFNRSALFVLPSLYEGHPKTLLEAMACGLPVVGTDVSGIREIICHRENGYLCGTSPMEIRAAIQELLADRDMSARLGRSAREFVVQHFALERVARMELEVLQRVAA